ncbi:alpha-galactosidase [Lapidilactobacillus wuchangensis]|uniref:alpha-galactosidase n=1 Tax=Lapidilactobacillus wuchangensis TaxID=2486001 RepID=UPI000F7AA958|nr:alpha-galactosidase [Lapidilactobacillus wuchangensis]
MPIVFDQAQQRFHLFNQRISYVMRVYEKQYLLHEYFGSRINDFTASQPFPQVARSSFSPNPADLNETGFSLNTALQEYPGVDTGDYRDTAFAITYPDGTSATALKYQGYEIKAGKSQLSGLPATYVTTEQQATSLVIHLTDQIRQVQVDLKYTIFEDLPVITRSVEFKNLGTQTITLDKALSMTLDFPENRYQALTLPGEWASERQMQYTSLQRGCFSFDSKRGASSVEYHPFLGLLPKTTTENHGEAYGVHFIYSGNFRASAEVDAFEQTRVMMGINPYNFRWQLAAQATFQTPEVVLAHADDGLNDLSNSFHQLYREHLVPAQFKDQERPVLVNNWETTAFNFDEPKLLELADQAKKIGVELFVLDDGWFGQRDDDHSSLGDWQTDVRKLPNGIAHLAKEIHQRGLQFGLWFEPEMISPRSRLFEQHPDWYLHVADYPASLGRNQYVLDFSRAEIREAIFAQLTKILDEVPIDFIKWDMNRNISEVGSIALPPEQQGEVSHRYILGLYDLVAKLTNRYPKILFENCSGGAGRFDAGMSYYMPQSWTSDDTDAVERMKIQYGTSLMFSPIMMDAQISDVPNQQVGRLTPFKTRLDVAQSANFGVMLDLQEQTPENIQLLTERIAWYKEHRQLLQFGRFYRLLSPFKGDYAAWEFVAPSQDEAVLFFFQILNHASKPMKSVKIVGLKPEQLYQVGDQQLTGDYLAKFGLYLNMALESDFLSKVVEIKAVK